MTRPHLRIGNVVLEHASVLFSAADSQLGATGDWGGFVTGPGLSELRRGHLYEMELHGVGEMFIRVADFTGDTLQFFGVGPFPTNVPPALMGDD